jgi:hypothetical protein
MQGCGLTRSGRANYQQQTMGMRAQFNNFIEIGGGQISLVQRHRTACSQ